MTAKPPSKIDTTRDGIDALPEMEDIASELPFFRGDTEIGQRLEKALREEFSVRDPAAGRME